MSSSLVMKSKQTECEKHLQNEQLQKLESTVKYLQQENTNYIKQMNEYINQNAEFRNAEFAKSSL